LILDHEVIHLPSVTILSLLRERATRSKPRELLAVIGDPVFDLDDPRWGAKKSAVDIRTGSGEPLPWPRLEYSNREARAILRIAPKSGVLGAIGFEANRSLFESGRLSDFKILHFATHGLFDDSSPQLSALALSAWDRQGRPLDGLLRAYELAQSTLRADLVVASACRTGLHGDGALGQGGLTQAFLRAGAQRVIVSLWDADDRATSELMSLFYRGLLVDRLTPSQALRRAQISLLNDARWAAPFYWGAFVIEGDWI
jgi:CHAT domain-containing protein